MQEVDDVKSAKHEESKMLCKLPPCPTKTLECTADDPVAGDSGMVRRRARVKFLRS